MKKIKIMSVFGTRPEAIKMAPVVKALEADDAFESIVCVTAQHREMLDQVLELFEIKPDYDLDIMQHGQTLSDITCRVLKGLESVIQEVKPDMVLVHGDTSTTLAASLASFYNHTKVGHVEAGLRSFDLYSPFPEELNRSLTGRIANLHFSPTKSNVDNLLREGMAQDTIYQVGNTVIDALIKVIKPDYTFEDDSLNLIDYENRKVLLLTAHRRENLGESMCNIFSAVRRIINEFQDTELIFPMHKNPKIRELADTYLSGSDRIHLIEPLEYEAFANIMAKSDIILTDSGGIQEEAPALGKPVLVLRKETERPEAVEAGTVLLAGIEEETIYEMTAKLLRDSAEYDKMANAVNPYGDGKTSERITGILKKYFGQ
jgi:UDP-N-acetylglucosamine 2-epimerase (non-hydrolysing)